MDIIRCPSGEDLVRTTEDEDRLIFEGIVRLHHSDRPLNRIDGSVIDSVIDRMCDAGKHLSWKQYANLNKMLKRRRLEPVKLYRGGSDPDYGPERAERRREMLNALLDEPALDDAALAEAVLFAVDPD